MNKTKDKSYLDFAVDAMNVAGRIAMEYFRTGIDVDNKAIKRKFDPVTRADREVETCLRELIETAYPEHGIIGEEHGIKESGNGLYWVIDPIDGTRGFITGTPNWGMLLGLRDGDQCLAGAMHQPFLQETFAADETGAWFISPVTRRRITTRGVDNLGEAILCCTHPSMFHTHAERDAFQSLLGQCQFSRFGTECYGYCLLAHGFVDLVVESDLEAYDIVALIPIVEAAGGIITNWRGGSAIDGGSVVAAANRELHEQALEYLNKV